MRDARITGTLVGGDFCLPRDPSVPLLLAAGGIGVTPFISQLMDQGFSDLDILTVRAIEDSEIVLVDAA